MAKYEFNVKNIKEVSIDTVVPNGWNPKEKDTKEYQKVRDSIKKKGLLGYILVREHPYQEGYYEIIDGEQRYTSAKELHYKKLNIYNAGIVDEKDAKELTIWFQQQVPFSRITEAYLVSELVDEYGFDNVEIPYNEQEIKDLSGLANFDFDQYDDKGEFKESGDGTQANADGTITFTAKLEADDYEIVTSALAQYAKDNNSIDIAHALVMVCTELRIDQGGDE